ncbi:MAG: putative ABC-type nitrate/sulfonate/bicarbonate transport system permease component [Rhodospirillales bacterium]|nr:putative ABC-type nitrate/sulfonate/bicarbonate transport system permease component [Rhodospirillales bacterium]
MTSEAKASHPLRGFFGSSAIRRVLLILLLAAIWEGYGRFLGDDLLFPSLSKTVAALFASTESGELPSRLANSLTTLGLGYAAGIALAAILTTLAISTRFGADLLSMLTSMFSPLPAVALLPMAILWFGIGQPAIVFVIMFSVLWVLVLNAQSGFHGVSPALRMTGYNLSLTGWRHVLFILAPAAFPSILSGLKIGWAFAWRTLIAAELVFGASSRSGGLGWFIAEHRNELAIDQVFAGMLVVILVGLLVEIGIFRTIEKVTVIRWGMQRG